MVAGRILFRNNPGTVQSFTGQMLKFLIHADCNLKRVRIEQAIHGRLLAHHYFEKNAAQAMIEDNWRVINFTEVYLEMTNKFNEL